MTPGKILLLGAAAFVCAIATTPLSGLRPAAAQGNPTMTNVVPDGGTYATTGKVYAYNPGAHSITIAPAVGGEVMPMVIPPGVTLDSDVEVGDYVSVHYSRTVNIIVSTPKAPLPTLPTETVEKLATSPGGFGTTAATVTGTVTKINGPGSINIVDHSGGGVYTVKTNDPARRALLNGLKVGETVTVKVGPLVLTALAECGLFGQRC
jgi:hypothetical protein